MEQRITTYSQYAISSNVNGIKDIEAETVNGISVRKIYFQPDVNLDLATSQIVAATNSIRALMPTGTQPPVVVQYSASAVPVLQISLSSDRLSELQLYDYGIYRLRQMIAPVHGVTLPTPAGGKYRQIMVDIDPIKPLAKGLTRLQVISPRRSGENFSRRAAPPCGQAPAALSFGESPASFLISPVKTWPFKNSLRWHDLENA